MPIAESEFHNHCVLKVHYFTVRSHDNNHVIILSAGTDGKVAFWDMTLLFSIFLTQTESIGANTDKSTTKEEDTNSVSKPDSCITNKKDGLTSKEMASSDQEKLARHSDTKHKDKQETISVDPVFVISSHQSGVNSLDVYKLHGKSYNKRVGSIMFYITSATLNPFLKQ